MRLSARPKSRRAVGSYSAASGIHLVDASPVNHRDCGLAFRQGKDESTSVEDTVQLLSSVFCAGKGRIHVCILRSGPYRRAARLRRPDKSCGHMSEG